MSLLLTFGRNDKSCNIPRSRATCEVPHIGVFSSVCVVCLVCDVAASKLAGGRIAARIQRDTERI